jgi:SRSO17 transposase
MKQATLSTLATLLVNFIPAFSKPSHENFTLLVRGWILCIGSRTISRVLQFGGFDEEQRRHHVTFYRFFSRATWKASDLGEIVFRQFLKVIPPNGDIVLVVDDTLCRKQGAHIWGAGMHHDPLLSNYGRGSKLLKQFSFGHSWVILCLHVPLPWRPDRGMAIPVHFRLYRPKKQTPEAEYKKRTQLAREMITEVERWVPQGRRICVVGDSEYSCETVVNGLPERFVFVGAVHMDAALYALAEPRSGRGRPRKKGARLPSPKELATRDTPWEEHSVAMYGRVVQVLIKTQVCLWYTVAGTRLVRVIVTRDPSGRIGDRAYFSTDSTMSVETLAQRFSYRWTQEEMHRNLKQHLGVDDPQNGWWHRPPGQRKSKTVPGPQPDQTTGSKAVQHTVPFVLTVYALVVLWYFHHGTPDEDAALARQRAPWYRHKLQPSFGDMLHSLRRAMWAELCFDHPHSEPHTSKNFETLQAILTAA